MRTPYIIILILFFVSSLTKADNEIDGPNMGWDDDTSPDSTAFVSSPPTRPTDSAYYDMQGHKVTTPIKGHIYIHQGKKVLSQ